MPFILFLRLHSEKINTNELLFNIFKIHSPVFFFFKVVETMFAAHSFSTTAIIITYILVGPGCSMSYQKKTSCCVQDGRADCSHLSLSAVPQDLPTSIHSLDMSHNRLRGVQPGSLTRYPGLAHLDVSHNSITKLDGGLCKTLNLLQTLDMAHNQLLNLQMGDLIHCTNLTHLILASNKLRRKGEAFSVLQVCRSH